MEENLCVDVLDPMKESFENWYLIVNGKRPGRVRMEMDWKVFLRI